MEERGYESTAISKPLVHVDLGLGVPSFQDTFDTASSCFYLGSDGQIQFEVKDRNLVMSTTGIVGDRWRIAELTSLSNFYLEVTARSGEIFPIYRAVARNW